MTIDRLGKRVSALERRCGPPARALPDGLKMDELSFLAVDVLEAVTRAWPGDRLPPGLCAGVAEACDRPPAERSMAISMALGRHWPEGEGNPMALMAALTSCGILPGPEMAGRGVTCQ